MPTGLRQDDAGGAAERIGNFMAENGLTSQLVFLADELRALRESTGLSQRSFARQLNIDVTTVNKVERAKRPPTPLLLRAWLGFCGVSNAGIDDFIRRAEGARHPTWWADHGESVPTWFERYLRLEEAAGRKMTYQSELVPGLAQTGCYTAAVVAANKQVGASGGAEHLIAMRARRQRRLVDPAHPAYPMQFVLILNEAVLRRPIGGPEVMREQLAYLVELALLPHVTLLILPFAAGAHPAMTGSFSLLKFITATINTVYLEHINAATYVDDPDGVRFYEAVYADLIHLALGEEGSIALVEQVAKELVDATSAGVA